MKESSMVFAVIFAILLSGCLGGYAGTDWRSIFEKQQGEKIELTGYIGGEMPYPQQIYEEGEQRGYLLNEHFGKQTAGIPLIVQEQINCDSNHVKIHGEVIKRDVQPMGSDFIEMLDWIMIKVESAECIP